MTGCWQLTQSSQILTVSGWHSSLVTYRPRPDPITETELLDTLGQAVLLNAFMLNEEIWTHRCQCEMPDTLKASK